ncbi:MAG: DUF5113 domain-containing protein [Bacteroidaceae bacterium]|nr:DUF5113 domain-containing protein [Bacteroidaceae bacterium]
MLNRFSFALLLAFCISFAGCKDSHEEMPPHAASLCNEMWNDRYKSIARLDSLSLMLKNAADGNNELLMIAENAEAYAAMMRMDYAAAVALYSHVLEESDCEIERLAADVGLMTVCYRVSENRRFFDYRTDALSRIKRINEEVSLLADSDKQRFIRAKIEFGIVSICYFSNLGMQEEKKMALEYLEKNIDAAGDAGLRLYAQMIVANNTFDAHERTDMLFNGLSASARLGQTWLVANYKLLLAISLRDRARLDDFISIYPEYYAALNISGMPSDELPLALAVDAADAFGEYGDKYMMIEALSVSASCNTEYGRYEDALVIIEDALGCINDYYLSYYPQKEELCRNSLYAFNEEEAVLQDNSADKVYNIPECLLSVRREASCAFAGVGDIEASNINYNAYLTLLRNTRQNKRFESSVSIAQESAAQLNYLLAVMFVLLVAVIIAVYVMRRRRKRYELNYSANLKLLQKVCRRLLTSLPRDAASKEELCQAVLDVLNSDMGNFSGKVRFSFSKLEPNEEMPFLYEFSLQYLNGESGSLFLAAEKKLIKEKQSIISMLAPYVAAAIEEGLRLSNISDEREKTEEELKAYSIYLCEHKRENLLKRVSVSMVMSMRPFMDRLMGELNALPGDESKETTERRLRYITELAERLNELNIILERWIKMRRGELPLQIESFALDGIFEIIEKSRTVLERREITLEVKECNAFVKADKALTLFMVNTLVENASKFTLAGGKVTLEGVVYEDCVEIAVTDTGIGLSQTDIERILGEKVYDASNIGVDNASLPADSKGGGFGLLNCKGIIEKYRKSDAIFSVCSMDIKSEPGKGSRFSFRLPKSVQRIMLILLMLLPVSLYAASEDVLDKVSLCVDSVYYSNVNGYYEDAFVYAQDAISLLNEYYKANVGGADTLTLYSGSPNELKWWRDNIFPSSLEEKVYHNILDIRNEIAVASLAQQRWQTYRYNNYIYNTLYRLVHEDKGVAEEYSKIKNLLNYREAAVALLLFVLIMLLLYFAVTYLRHNIIGRRNEQMVLKANRRMLQIVSGKERLLPEELLQKISNEIYTCLSEGMCMKRVAIMLRRNSEEKPVLAETGEQQPFGASGIFLLGVIDSGMQYLSPDGLLRVLPLSVLASGEREQIGAIEILTSRPLVENEILNLELVANYAATAVYHALVRVESSYTALEELEEETNRIKYEESRLHVQNMVLDNCLSVIKHETIYYPSRISELACKCAADGSNSDAVASMRELMDYYNSIFGILSNCAKRELDDRCFSIKKTGLQHLFDEAQNYAVRLEKKNGCGIKLLIEPTTAVASIDGDLVEYLLEMLLNAAFKVRKAGTLILRAVELDDDVRVELADSRCRLTSEEVAGLFVPTKRNIVQGDSLSGMEYLVAKEIVRVHEDATGKRGSRMEARSDAAGTVIVFTLPK